MNVKSVLLIISLIFLVCAGTVFAQDNKKDTELTVDELYLLTNDPEYKILDAQARSGDRQTKMEALDGIEQMIMDGTMNQAVELILVNLAGEGTTIRQYEGRLVLNNYPEVRRKACTLLGQYGGPNAVNTLLGVLRAEQETMVLSEAVYALGVIGKDENGKMIKALAEVIDNQPVTTPDSNLAYSVILSFQKIAAANNGMKDNSGYNALIKIAQGNYMKGVKKLALDTLREMKRYN